MQIASQALQHRLDHASFAPALKTPMHGLIRSVARGQVLPGSASAQNPQNPIESATLIAPRTPSLILSDRIGRDEFLDHFPLLLCEVHPQPICPKI
jgi:hypothetical protein